MGELAEGVYESLHTAGLSRQLADAVRHTLSGVCEESARVALVNELVSLLVDEEADVVERLEQLISLSRHFSPGGREMVRPVTRSRTPRRPGRRS